MDHGRAYACCLPVRCKDCGESGRIRVRVLKGGEARAVRDAQSIFLHVHRAVGCNGVATAAKPERNFGRHIRPRAA